MLSEVFETKVAAFLVATGTAANALALSALARALGGGLLPRGGAYPRRRMRRAGILHRRRQAGRHPGRGRQDHAGGAARRRWSAFRAGSSSRRSPARCRCRRRPKPGRSTASTRSRRSARSPARAGVGVHMDGARFANALVSPGVSPAEMTWRAGVDALSLRGDQERRARLRGGRLLRPGAGGEFRLTCASAAATPCRRGASSARRWRPI